MYLGLCSAFVAVRAFSSFGERRLLSVVELGLLTAVAPLAGAPSPGARASVVVANGLSRGGSRALGHRLNSHAPGA